MTTLPEVSALPDLLTVEEAARLLRIGRTKAYALTREWRATNGRSGLPVVDLGSVLRVPRYALEQLLGAPLVGPPVALATDGPVPAVRAAHLRSTTTATAAASPPPASRVRNRVTAPPDQLDLFASSDLSATD